MTALISVAALVAVILSFVTAVLGLLNQRKIKDAAVTSEDTAGKIAKISIDVNGRLSQLFERQAQLIGTLREAGVPVPALPAPSLLASEPENTLPPDTGENMAKKAHLADAKTVLAKFFETTLPAAGLKIEELQRQGIKNLRAFEDLLADLPHAAAAAATVVQALPPPTPAAAKPADTLPGEQKLPEG